MRRTSASVVAALIALVGFSAQSHADGTIASIVAASAENGVFDDDRHDYDILLTAVLNAEDGVLAALSDESAELTVWAPNDAAFIRTARDLGYRGFSEQGAWEFLVAALTELSGDTGDGVALTGLLTAILEYHVAGEEITAFQFILRSFFRVPVQTAQGGTFQPFFFRVIDNDPDLRDARLRFPLNINATNGIIHNVNRVLIPIDIP